MFKHTSNTLLTISACLVICSNGAWAGTVTGVTSAAALGADDFIDWGQIGPEGTTVTTPSVYLSNNGQVGLFGSVGGGDLMNLVQGSGWNGNFNPGDNLLWNQGNNENIAIQPFTAPLYGFGANIEADFYGPFTATVTAYDLSFNVIGIFSENGDANTNGDGSAIFIGLKDTKKEIAFASFDVVDSYGNAFGEDFAINTLLLNTTGQGIPEPGSVAMLVGMGLTGASLLTRKRSSRK